MKAKPAPIPVIEYEAPVDWGQVIDGLRGAGLSFDDIAAANGIAKSTLMGWRKPGAEPKHCDGERLLNFWRSRGGGTIPRVSRS